MWTVSQPGMAHEVWDRIRDDLSLPRAIVQTGKLRPIEVENRPCGVCSEGHPVPACSAPSGKGRMQKGAESGTVRRQK